MEIEQHDIEQDTEYVPYLEDVAVTIRDDAIEQACSKLSVFQRDWSLEQLLKDNSFIDHFKYGLATGTAKSLAAHDTRVQAIYIFDPSDNPEGRLDLPVEMTIHLIVKVSASSAALDAFIESFDQALVRSLQGLPSPLLEKRSFIMDVNIVTDEEARHRVGYAVLLSSMFAPAFKIWERDS